MLPNNQRNFSDQFRALVGAVTAQYNAVSLQEFRNSSISFKSKSSPPRSQFETVNIAAKDLKDLHERAPSVALHAPPKLFTAVNQNSRQKLGFALNPTDELQFHAPRAALRNSQPAVHIHSRSRSMKNNNSLKHKLH